MKATLAQLEAFYWIARLGSFHAAARQLCLTQPTVSARIAELEGVLGQQLFDRAKRRAQITPAARDLVGIVERMLKLGDEITRRARTPAPMRGLLRLGAVESVALIVLPRLLPRLVNDFPDLEIALTLDIGSALSVKLNAREIDLAILTDPQVGEHVHIEPAGRIELRWIAGRDLKLPEGTLRPDDLSRVTVLSNPQPSSVYQMTREWFASAGLEPAAVSSCNSLTLMARLIAAGHGIAILPPAIIANELRSGKLRVLQTRPALEPRVMYIAHLGESDTFAPLIVRARQALRDSRLLRSV